MSIDEAARAVAALGGAGVMLIVSRFVWSMSFDELARQRARAEAAEADRDRFAAEAAAYRHQLVSAGIEPAFPGPDVPTR